MEKLSRETECERILRKRDILCDYSWLLQQNEADCGKTKKGFL